MPSLEMSSSRPTKGETYVAPALAANSACPGEKTRVQFVRMPFVEKWRMALMPSAMQGTLTTMCGSRSASTSPSRTMPSKSVEITSALTSPPTMRQIST